MTNKTKLPDQAPFSNREIIWGALSRGYCTTNNAHKTLDQDLILDMTEEVLKLNLDQKPKAIYDTASEQVDKGLKFNQNLKKLTEELLDKLEGSDSNDVWEYTEEVIKTIKELREENKKLKEQLNKMTNKITIEQLEKDFQNAPTTMDAINNLPSLKDVDFGEDKAENKEKS